MADKIPASVVDTLIGEAGGEGEEGIIAAAWAIQQRAAARGQTIDQVVRSGFDGFSNPGREARKMQRDPEVRAKVERIMQGVQRGTIPNPVPRADHFLSGDVMPGWARNMELVGTVGGHRFYASGNVPDSAIGRAAPRGNQPGVVASTKPKPIAPVMPTPIPADLASSRQFQGMARNALAGATPTAPSSAFMASMYPTPKPVPTMVTGRGVSDSVENTLAREQGRHGALDAILERQVAASQRPAPPMPRNVAQSYVGQERQPAPIVTTIATIPTRPQVSGAVSYAGQDRGATPGQRLAPPMPMQTAQSYVTQDRAATRTTPVSVGSLGLPIIGPSGGSSFSTPPSPPALPRMSTAQLRADNGQRQPTRPMTPEQIATVPYGQGATIASVPTTAIPKPTMTTAQLRADNGQGRPAPRSTGPYIPGPPSVVKDEARLSPGQWSVVSINGTPPVVASPINVVPAPIPVAGFPTPASMRPGMPRLPSTGFPTPPTFGSPISGFPTPFSSRPSPALPTLPVPRPIVGFPTAASQRPGMSLLQMAMPRPVAQSPATRPPLNVVVQGAGTIYPNGDGGGKGGGGGAGGLNLANHDPAQLAALAEGRSTFTPSGGGGLEPVRAMNGNIRYTY